MTIAHFRISRTRGVGRIVAGGAAPIMMVLVMVLIAPVRTAAQDGLAPAIALHEAGRAGDRAATPQAVEAFETIVESAPEYALARAYLGSAYALTARDADGFSDKMRYANRALRHLDLAVEQMPEDFMVRLLRANITTNLPRMLGRDDETVEDMKILDRAFSARPIPALAERMAVIYGHLAERAPEDGDWTAKAAAARDLAGR